MDSRNYCVGNACEMTCQHTRVRDIATHCYSGSVAGPDGEENRAAHGNVCVTYECADCGARAAANVNGRHVEWSAWGPSRAEREQVAYDAERTVRVLRDARPKPVTLRHGGPDGETIGRVQVAIDDEGYLVITGDGAHPSGEDCLRAAPSVVQYASNLRVAHQRAVELRAEV